MATDDELLLTVLLLLPLLCLLLLQQDVTVWRMAGGCGVASRSHQRWTERFLDQHQFGLFGPVDSAPVHAHHDGRWQRRCGRRDLVRTGRMVLLYRVGWQRYRTVAVASPATPAVRHRGDQCLVLLLLLLLFAADDRAVRDRTLPMVVKMMQMVRRRDGTGCR